MVVGPQKKYGKFQQQNNFPLSLSLSLFLSPSLSFSLLDKLAFHHGAFNLVWQWIVLYLRLSVHGLVCPSVCWSIDKKGLEDDCVRAVVAEHSPFACLVPRYKVKWWIHAMITCHLLHTASCTQIYLTIASHSLILPTHLTHLWTHPTQHAQQFFLTRQ